jgi:hypothetical protein
MPLRWGIEHSLDRALVVVDQLLPVLHELPRSLVDAGVLRQRLVVKLLRVKILLERERLQLALVILEGLCELCFRCQSSPGLG